VYAYNRTNDQFYASQTINTTHTNVFAVAGTLSRFATCGPDSNVLVYYFSQKTGLYTLNQTVSSVISATGCTALDFAPTELNIVVGRGKNVAVLTRDQNFVYSVSSPLMADDEGVTYAKFTTDGIYFVTGGISTTKLWTRANGFTASSQTLNLGTVSGDWTNNNYRYALGVLQRTPNIDNILQLRATGCTTSQNTTNPTQCNCGASVWSNGTCTTLSCTGVQNSNGAATADGWACVCNTGFVWDANLGVCKTDCSPAVTPNSNGTNYEYLSCFCNSGYFWNYALGVCYVNCAGQANSNGTNFNQSQCNCNNGSLWNSSTGRCEINCTGQANSNGTNLNATYCACNSGFLWNPSVSACYWSCSGAVNSNGTNYNATQCNCNPNTAWNATTLSCNVNCSALNNSNGTNVNATTCFCNASYLYNASASLCYYNCSGISNSPGTNFNATHCNCNASYVWNATANQCWLDCSDNKTNSNGTASSISSCYCNATYVWNTT
jgi:hypothetical protein